ncbi:hypothetical protein [Sulfurimonas paralvinellae]|uniref:Thioredoxin-like fold domain-containing protein n=1 Tax=Sulfurimonas paralvinellae TaxID=317658 RepID=A0A7M1B7X6_9BACT|nr:hypothetical protein [Sulfurimonas paralvinellae]QOP45804.1 hypothetical protein FM071_05680 [Sulfurimonas paralvinellae]
MQDNVCHEMSAGEVLNASHAEYPLHEALIYGSRLDCAKFSKRLSCAIKHLPIRVRFSFEHDPQKAIEQGITKDPTLVLDGEIFLEGLTQAEAITEAFEKLI